MTILIKNKKFIRGRGKAMFVSFEKFRQMILIKDSSAGQDGLQEHPDISEVWEGGRTSCLSQSTAVSRVELR